MNITLLTSGHPPMDDRIFHKLGRSLAADGHRVSICASTADMNDTIDKVNFYCFDGRKNSKLFNYLKFFRLLCSEKPDCIIVSEIMPLFPSFVYKMTTLRNCSLFYDATEWYPEIVFNRYDGIKKHLLKIALYLVLFMAMQLVDCIIAGERTKLSRLKNLAPQKPVQMLPYYPVLSVFPYWPLSPNRQSLHLAFSGLLTRDRGFFRFLDSVISFRKAMPETKIAVTIVGRFLYESDELNYRKIVKESGQDIVFFYYPWQPYDKFGEVFRDVEICVDLRESSFVYQNSLPIKLFDYLAMGKAVIYTLNNAILNELDITQFGKWTIDQDSVCDIYKFYLENPEELKKHSLNARRAAEEKYNWESAFKFLKLDLN